MCYTDRLNIHKLYILYFYMKSLYIYIFILLYFYLDIFLYFYFSIFLLLNKLALGLFLFLYWDYEHVRWCAPIGVNVYNVAAAVHIL